MNMFKKATKSQFKIRLALSGASGAGKTFSALSIASHLGNSIAVIDTEHGSASRYADKFSFDVCELENHHPSRYIEAIQVAEQAGYEVIIIDSLSHAWFSELELAGKGFDGWKNVRPLERKLIDAMIGCSSHIIATMRSKTEYIMEEYRAKDGKTKTAPKKIGTAPVQSAGIEYEFDIAGELNYEHILTIGKTRCSELTDRTFLNPGLELANILKDWTTSAVPDVASAPQSQPKFASPQATQSAPQKAPVQLPSPSIAKLENTHLQPQRQEIQKEFQRLRWVESQIKECLINNFNSELLIQLNAEELNDLKNYLEVFERSTALIKKHGWSPNQGKKFLLQHYEKEGRASLTREELEEFVDYLEELPKTQEEVAQP
ncbi:ATP-binding protein [Microcoleus sp. herbarium7]|uniref:ATP-binding protein n=1 Tax=Microcoleus sp. herbarium7 TaxID=3055435 RepID=UPI002FD33857